MSEKNEGNGEGRRKGGFWAWMWARPRRWFLLGIPVGGFVAVLVGIALTGGFLTAVGASNTMEFCTSCHEMEAFVFEEYKESAHYSNASGVRVECADCHVPKKFFPKMVRKIQASLNEVPAHLMGKISTREKFEEHRGELAQKVWDRMEANDSLACRNCHSYEAMNAEEQDRYARRRHSEEYREATGKTCIDCHQGVAHELPESM